MKRRCVLTRWLKFCAAVAIVFWLPSGCVCRLQVCPTLELSKIRQGVSRGDRVSMRALLDGVAEGRWEHVTLREALGHARNLASAGTPEDTAMVGLLAQAMGDDQEAFTSWLAVAADTRTHSDLAWAALSWADRLVDRVDLDKSYEKPLLRSLERQGRTGLMAAELAHNMAVRWKSEQLRVQAVARKGWIRHYLRGGRLGPLPIHVFEAGKPHGAMTSGSELNHLLPPDAWQATETPDGSIAFAEDGPGVYVARWTLPANNEATELTVWANGSVWVESAGQTVLVHDALNTYGPKGSSAIIEPGPARTLDVFVASQDSAPELRMAAHSVLEVSRESQAHAPQGVLGALVAFEHALRHGELGALTRQARILERCSEGLCAGALARFHEMDASRPESVTEPVIIALLHRAIERYPNHLRVRRMLVERRLLLSDVEQARGLVLGAMEAPIAWRLEMKLALAEAADDEGRRQELSEELLKRRPTSCSAFNAWVFSEWDRLRYGDSELLLNAPGCVDTQLHLVRLWIESGALERAESALKHIALLAKPGQERSQVQQALGYIAYRRNHWTGAEKYWTDALTEGVRREALVEQLIRLYRLQGKDFEAQGLMVAAGSLSTTSASQQHGFVALKQDLDLPLLDGKAIALESQARRLASKVEEDSLEEDGRGSVEVLLDDRFIRVLPNGSSIHRAHLMFQILDAHRAEQWGEVPLPPEAEVLIARTWKPTPDGRLQPIEPEDLMNLGVVSLSALEQGAIGEVAYVWVVPPSKSLAPGWMTPPIFLDRSDAVLRHGRFRLRVPPSQEVSIHQTGDVPAPEITNGETRLYQWEVKDRARKISEPLDPRPERRFSSVQVGSQVSTAGLRGHYWAQLLYRLRQSPTLQELVNEALGSSEQTAREKLKSMYGFVLDRVQSGEGGPWSGNASFVAATRTGERTLVLAGMCRAAGLQCDYMLARPQTRGVRDGIDSLPNQDDWVYPLIRAKLASGDIWLDPSHPYVPFGYLPPLVQGVPALLLGQGPLTVQTPMLESEEGQCQVNLDIQIGQDGQFVVRAEEVLTGLYAMSWRRALVSMGEEIRHRALGRILRRILPTVQEVDVRIDGLEQRGKPLILNWHGQGRLMANQGVFELSMSLYGDELAASTVLLPERKTPLFSNHANALNMTVTVSLPETWKVLTSFRGEEIRHPLVKYQRSTAFDPSSRRFTVEKKIHLKPGLIGAEAYPSWSVAARAVDRADVLHLKLGPEPSKLH